MQEYKIRSKVQERKQRFEEKLRGHHRLTLNQNVLGPRKKKLVSLEQNSHHHLVLSKPNKTVTPQRAAESLAQGCVEYKDKAS